MNYDQAINIEVHGEFGPLREDWLALQSGGVATLYQTFEWCSTWHQVLGAARGVEPQIVTGRDSSGQIRFILPFGIYQHGGYRVVEWLASDLATYGLGVYDQTLLTHRPDAVIELWPSILEALPHVDAIWLRHLPEQWRGATHPLHGLFTTQSANQTFQVRLATDYEHLHATKRSGDSRRRIRKRDARLLACGDVQIGLPQSPADADRLLDELIARQTEFLATRGVFNLFEDGTAKFFKHLSEPGLDSQVLIFPQYLTVDGDFVAAKLGFIFDRTYWAMISATGTGQLGKHSPGDFVLRETIRACCERGLDTFDFATGNAPYKQVWADNSVTLHEVIIARSARGMLWTTAKRASIEAKRTIKESDFLWPAFKRLRQAAMGSRTRD